MSDDNQCSLCGQSATQKCSGCQLVYYCCRDHQKSHWKKHKYVCQPMKLCQDEKLGRYFIANRTIKYGELVLKEAPLIQGPSQITGPVCLSCLQSISTHSSEECPKCGWPMCRSPKCLESEKHRPECDWTVNKRGRKVKISNFTTPHPTYESITVLRCLYQKSQNPKIWKKLMGLEAHTDKRKETSRYETDRRTVVQFIQQFYKLGDMFSEEDIMKMCGVLQVNAHEIPLTEPSNIAIFDRTSFIEHSCSPNIYKSFTNNGEVILRAMKDIAPGEHLSICYTDPLWGTINRRHHLLESKFFLCECDRCKDPTESFTFYSGVKCSQKKCDGYVLPHITPNVIEETWICNECKENIPNESVHEILTRIGEELSKMEKQDPTVCEKFLKLYGTGKLLHPNHYYLTDVRIALGQLYGQTSQKGIQGISDDNLNQKIELCKQVMCLTKVTIPAEGRIRGIIIFELHAAIAEAGRRRSNEGAINSSQLEAFLMESKKYLEEAVFLLQYEPSMLPEGQILIQAKANLRSLDSVLVSMHAAMGDSPI